jgi:glucose-1-phosphate thymidylyltransferase
VIPPVFVHPEAIVERSVIGPYVSIEKDAEIRDSILRDAIVDEAAKIEAETIEDSIIGRWVEITGRFRQLNVGDNSTLE